MDNRYVPDCAQADRRRGVGEHLTECRGGGSPSIEKNSNRPLRSILVGCIAGQLDEFREGWGGRRSQKVKDENSAFGSVGRCVDRERVGDKGSSKWETAELLSCTGCELLPHGLRVSHEPQQVRDRVGPDAKYGLHGFLSLGLADGVGIDVNPRAEGAALVVGFVIARNESSNNEPCYQGGKENKGASLPHEGSVS